MDTFHLRVCAEMCVKDDADTYVWSHADQQAISHFTHSVVSV